MIRSKAIRLQFNSIIRMQNNRMGRSSLRKSFIQRRQSQLFNYMVKQIGIEEQLSKMLIKVHHPSTITDVLNLFLTDQNGLFNHIFIPDEQNQQICKVCQGKVDTHRIVDNQIQKHFQDIKLAHENFIQNISQQGQKEEKFTCDICYIKVVANDILTINEQSHNVCLQCVDAYIKEQINNMRIQQLGCPHCRLPFSSAMVQELTDQQTFNKYKIFLRNIEIQKNPNLKWCPNPKCSVVINTNIKSNTTICPKCKTQICNKCNRESHPQSCHKAFEKQIKDWQNASDIQKCKKCQGIVEKIAGCNHMTCSICHYQWCWLCGSRYSHGHYSSLNPFGCPGLQDQQRDDWGKQKIFLLRLALLFLIIIGIPILFPLALLACGPALIGNMIWNRYYPDNLRKKFLIILISIIFGLMIDPIVWIGGLFYLIPKGITSLIELYRQRRQMNERNQNYLRNRLLNNENIEQIIISQ